MKREPLRTTGDEGGRRPTLEIIRGFAAMWVFACHLLPYAALDVRNSLHRGLGVVISWGWMGVDIFIVLSGLVITLNLSRIEGYPQYRRARWFFGQRLARLAPLHYLTCVLCLALLSGAAAPGSQLVRNLLFLQNLTWTWPAINFPNWSIGLELDWYLLAFFVFRQLRGVPVGLLLAIGMLSSLAWGLVTWAVFRDVAEADFPVAVFFSSQLPGFLFQFLLGSQIPRLRLPCAWWKAFLCSFVLLALTIVMRRWINASVFQWSKQGGLWVFIFTRPMLAVSIGGMIWSVWELKLHAPAWRVPVFLGTISYSIYLWHNLVIQLMASRLSGDAMLTASTLTVLLVATISWFWFERPFVRAARGLRGQLS